MGEFNDRQRSLVDLRSVDSEGLQLKNLGAISQEEAEELSVSLGVDGLARSNGFEHRPISRQVPSIRGGLRDEIKQVQTEEEDDPTPMARLSNGALGRAAARDKSSDQLLSTVDLHLPSDLRAIQIFYKILEYEKRLEDSFILIQDIQDEEYKGLESVAIEEENTKIMGFLNVMTENGISVEELQKFIADADKYLLARNEGNDEIKEEFKKEIYGLIDGHRASFSDVEDYVRACLELKDKVRNLKINQESNRSEFLVDKRGREREEERRNYHTSIKKDIFEKVLAGNTDQQDIRKRIIGHYPLLRNFYGAEEFNDLWRKLMEEVVKSIHYDSFSDDQKLWLKNCEHNPNDPKSGPRYYSIYHQSNPTNEEIALYRGLKRQGSFDVGVFKERIKELSGSQAFEIDVDFDSLGADSQASSSLSQAVLDALGSFDK